MTVTCVAVETRPRAVSLLTSTGIYGEGMGGGAMEVSVVGAAPMLGGWANIPETYPLPTYVRIAASATVSVKYVSRQRACRTIGVALVYAAPSAAAFA